MTSYPAPSVDERRLREIQLANSIKTGLYSLVEQKTKRKSAEHFQFICSIVDENDSIIKDYVACSKCKEAIYYNSDHGSSPLIRHYKEKHKGSGSSITMDAFVQRSIKNFTTFDKEKAKSVSTDFVVKDLRPFEAICGSGLIALLMFFTQLGHKYGPLTHDDIAEILPSPQTISRNIEKIGNECKNKIKEEVVASVPRGISMTTDLWTDSYRRVSYLCITAHYFVEIGKKFVYRSRITCLKPMDPKKKEKLTTYCWKQSITKSMNLGWPNIAAQLRL